jgi:hypothetical protein
MLMELERKPQFSYLFSLVHQRGVSRVEQKVFTRVQNSECFGIGKRHRQEVTQMPLRFESEIIVQLSRHHFIEFGDFVRLHLLDVAKGMN